MSLSPWKNSVFRTPNIFLTRGEGIVGKHFPSTGEREKKGSVNFIPLFLFRRKGRREGSIVLLLPFAKKKREGKFRCHSPFFNYYWKRGRREGLHMLLF